MELEALLGQAVPLIGAAVGANGAGALAEADDAPQDTAIDAGQRLVRLVWRLSGQPAALQAAVVDLADAPGGADALAALRLQLRKLLSGNQALAAQVAQMLPAPTWRTDWPATGATDPPVLDRDVIVQFLRDDGRSGGPALLRLLSCCAPHPAPVHLLLPYGRVLPVGADPSIAQQVAYLTADWLTLDQALITLGERGLIGPMQRGAVWVHRTVRAATLDTLQEQERAAWVEAAAHLVQRSLPESPESPETWPAYAALWPHAEALLPAWHTSRRLVARYFSASGDYAAACESARRIADACAQRHGHEHPDTLDARCLLAQYTADAGDATAARDLFAALVRAHKRVLGRDHPKTLSARQGWALYTGNAGNAARARRLFAALVPDRERVSGAEHPDTLTARQNLAHFTGQAGDAATARDLLAALLPARERVSGAEHPDTLTARQNLAHFTGQAGDAIAARDSLAQLLPVYERVIGIEHPATLRARNNLAHWTTLAPR